MRGTLRAKKLRSRKCDMRGCRNKNSYSLTIVNEFGNSIILCEECMRKIAVLAVNLLDKNAKHNSVIEITEANVNAVFAPLIQAYAEKDSGESTEVEDTSETEVTNDNSVDPETEVEEDPEGSGELFEAEDDSDESIEDVLNEMSVEELKMYCSENNIEVGKASTKEGIIKKIKAVD